MQALHRRGDHVAVIELVDRWRADGEPTLLARQALVEALLALGLVQRAAPRVDELPHGPERAALQERLDARSGAPVAEPPVDASLDAQLDAAVAMLASGAQARARRVVDAASARHAPSARMQAILWAVHGGPGLGRSAAEALVARTLGKRSPGARRRVAEELEDATQITRLELHADDDATQITPPLGFPVDDTDGGAPAETTQIVRVVQGARSGSWKTPVLPAAAPEEEDERVVILHRREAAPAVTRRPLPVVLPPRAEVDDLPELDDDALDLVDVEVEPLDAAPSAPPTRATASTEEPASLGGLVAVAVVAMLVAGLGLLLVVWALAAAP